MFQKIIRTVNISSLPDGGIKLQNQIKDITFQLKAIDIDIGKGKQFNKLLTSEISKTGFS